MTSTISPPTPTRPAPAGPSRSGRAAWLVLGSLFAVVALAFVGGQTVSVLAHDTETVHLTFPADGIEILHVDNDGGRIEILGDDGVDEISVTARVSHGLRRTGQHAEVDGNTLELRTTCPILWSVWCEVDYRIIVPSRLAVQAETRNGRMIIRDVAGNVIADDDNGSMELTRLSGDLQVSTDNGSLEATGLRSVSVTAHSDNGRVHLRFADPPQRVRATSDNGRVEIELPDTPDPYRVSVDTDNGSTDTAVRTDPSSDRTIDAATDNGDVSVHYPTG